MTRLFVLVLASLLVSGCGMVDSKRGIKELQVVEQRWIDGVRLASSTSKIALAPQVATLQSVRRDLKTVEVSECLKPAKEELDEHMDKVLSGFMEFMSGSKYQAEKMIEDGMNLLDGYKVLRDKCLSS